MNNRKIQNNPNINSDSSKKSFSFWTTVIPIIITILGFAYYAGRWTAQRENKEEIIMLNQKHNREIADLKIDFNYQIMELKNHNRELAERINSMVEKGENNE